MLSVGNPPAGAAHQRKLVAILCADIAGFSRLMGEDETATYEALARLRGAIDPLISQHGGRIVSTAGDGLLADFASIVDALGCAVEIQDEARRLNEPLPSGRRLELRIGVNLGDVIVAEDSDLYGDGVNIAARLQALASPGGICLSQMVYDQVKNKLALDFRPLGTHRVKNIVEPVRAYAVGTGSPVAAIGPITRRRRTVATICGFILVNAGLLAWLLGGPAVRESRVATGHAAAVAALAVPARLAERTPIAVLPFKNLSPDAGQDFFSDGISEDLINALGRFSNLLVAAKSASFQFKGRDVSPAEVGRVLDVRYLVEGSIRKSGDRLRVSVEVTEAATGFHMWSDMYNAELKDVFTVQDEITQRIVGAAAVKLTRLERDRALRKPTANLAAYEYLLRGRADLSNPSRAANYEARAQFQHAVDLDPNYADAYAAPAGRITRPPFRVGSSFRTTRSSALRWRRRRRWRSIHQRPTPIGCWRASLCTGETMTARLSRLTAPWPSTPAMQRILSNAAIFCCGRASRLRPSLGSKQHCVSTVRITGQNIHSALPSTSSATTRKQSRRSIPASRAPPAGFSRFIRTPFWPPPMPGWEGSRMSNASAPPSRTCRRFSTPGALPGNSAAKKRATTS